MVQFQVSNVQERSFRRVYDQLELYIEFNMTLPYMNVWLCDEQFGLVHDEEE